MFHNLEDVVDRFREVEGLLSDPTVIANQPRYRELTRAHSDLAGVVRAYGRYKQVLSEIAGNRDLLQDSDPEMKEMAREELPLLEDERLDVPRVVDRDEPLDEPLFIDDDERVVDLRVVVLLVLFFRVELDLVLVQLLRELLLLLDRRVVELARGLVVFEVDLRTELEFRPLMDARLFNELMLPRLPAL